MSAFVPVRRPASRLPSFRIALRELRGGVRGFGVFLACLALGVAAIAGVGSVARALSDGLAREGAAILGGDLAFTLALREANAEERELLSGLGNVSTVATLRAMTRVPDGGAALAEVKAVDRHHPLVGRMELTPGMPLAAALAREGDTHGAVVDPALLARLDVAVGTTVLVGDTRLRISGTIAREPDKLSTGLGFAPRLLISQEALDASGLVQPGSLVRWIYRVKLRDADDASLRTAAERARDRFPDAGWEVRTRAGAAPRMEDSVRRFAEFLALVGLTALLVGGVGVANAVKFYMERKQTAVAVLKAVGAAGGIVFRIYLAEIGCIALVGIAFGLAIGSALPFVVAWGFAEILPVPLEPSVQPKALAIAVGYGALVVLAFALWPLGRAHDVPVSALFRGALEPTRRLPRARYLVAAGLAAAALATLTIATAEVPRIAIIYVVSAAGAFVALRVLAWMLMALARRAPRSRWVPLRIAIGNVQRTGSSTPTVVLSLGLGLSLLVALSQIESNLRRQLTAALPDRAPSFFFVDVPSAEAGRFGEFVRDRAPGGRLDQVPILRGRIVRVKGVPVEQVAPDPEAAWVLRSDRGITFADAVPQGSTVVAGAWWTSGHSGPPLVSMEQRIAEGLGLAVGDEVSVNVLGRTIDATIANLRKVEWESLGINFVLVYSPNTFRGAPHSLLATLTFPDGADSESELSLLRTVAAAFPQVTTVRVKETLEAINAIVSDLALGIRGASAITLIASVLVLAGVLAAGHHHRVYEAVILKTLGATRSRLVLAYLLEYALLGLATAALAVATGALAAAYLVEEVMRFRFAFDPWAAAIAAAGGVAVTVVLGLVGTWRALGEKPARILRNL